MDSQAGLFAVGIGMVIMVALLVYVLRSNHNKPKSQSKGVDKERSNALSAVKKKLSNEFVAFLFLHPDHIHKYSVVMDAIEPLPGQYSFQFDNKRASFWWEVKKETKVKVQDAKGKTIDDIAITYDKKPWEPIISDSLTNQDGTIKVRGTTTPLEVFEAADWQCDTNYKEASRGNNWMEKIKLGAYVTMAIASLFFLMIFGALAAG